MALVEFAGAKLCGGEVGLVGGIGEVLGLYGYTLVVVIWTAGARGGRAFEPIAGVYLYAGLVGMHAKCATAFFGAEFHGVDDGVALGVVVEHPAVVISLSIFESGEVGVDILAEAFPLTEVHWCVGHGVECAGGYECVVGGEPAVGL